MNKTKIVGKYWFLVIPLVKYSTVHVYRWQRGAQIFQRNVHTKKAKKGRQKPCYGPDPTILILPLWRSLKQVGLGSTASVYIFQESGALGMLLSGWLQPELRKSYSPMWGAVPHHILSPLRVGPERGSEGGQTSHGTHAASIRPPAEECLAGTPGNTQQPLHSQTTSAGGWELVLMFYSSKLLFPTPENYTTEAVQFPLV